MKVKTRTLHKAKSAAPPKSDQRVAACRESSMSAPRARGACGLRLLTSLHDFGSAGILGEGQNPHPSQSEECGTPKIRSTGGRLPGIIDECATRPRGLRVVPCNFSARFRVSRDTRGR